jgi:hypothetical protein
MSRGPKYTFDDLPPSKFLPPPGTMLVHVDRVARLLEAYLKRTGREITISYAPQGVTNFKGDPRVWRAKIKPWIGSKSGYATDSLEHLIEAIITEAP